MNHQLIAWIISITSFTLLISIVWIKYGIQPSVSASYKKMNKDLFQLLLAIFAFSAIISGVNITTYDNNILHAENVVIFLAGAAIAFVAGAPAYYKPLESDVHFFAARAGILLGIVWLLLTSQFILAGVSVVLIILSSFVKNKVWWQELSAVYPILIGLFNQIPK